MGQNPALNNNTARTIAIIGAGIVGVSTAIWLQRSGHRVILIDKQGPAAGTSYGNGGVLASCAVIPVNAPDLIRSAPAMLFNPKSPLFIRWAYLPRMLPWLFRYIKRANKRDAEQTARALTTLLHDSLEQHQALAEGTGAEKWLKPSDYIFIYKDRAAFNKDAFAWNLRKKMGFHWQILEGSKLDEYEPIFQGTRNFGVRLTNHGTISDPEKYVKALASHMEEQGGRMLIATASDIKKTKNDIKGVQTDVGLVECDDVVLAAGIWSRPLAEKLGLNIPMETERGYHIELINPSLMPRSPMMLTSGKFVITPMEGRIRCAGIVEFGGLDLPESTAPYELLKQQVHEAIPGLTYERIEQWMGHRPAPSDSIPFIGPLKNTPGAYLAFGHHHIGLTGGPKTGRMIADMITARNSNIDLACYDVSRFTH